MQLMTLEDRYSTSHSEPTKDKSQDWKLTGHLNNETHTIIHMTRALDTKDAGFDRPIVDDGLPTHVIGAFGNMQGDGKLGFHGANKFGAMVNFFSNNPALTSPQGRFDPVAELATKKVASFNILNEFMIPNQVTTYHTTCTLLRDIPNIKNLSPSGELYLLGMDHIVRKKSEPYVHHFLVRLAKGCSNNRVSGVAEIGDGPLVYGWAPGVSGVRMPDDVSFPMGGTTGWTAITVQTHFHNENSDPGVFDTSGIKLFYTHQKTKHEAGMLSIGDPLTSLSGTKVGSPGAEYSQWQINCPGSCTSQGFDVDVNVFSEQHHMHATGVYMSSEVERDGKMIRHASTEYYDFNWQGYIPQNTCVDRGK
jgi:dimethyladenosine transferase 1